MNNVINFYQRQYGNSFSKNYDSLMSRLMVQEKDSWRGITPSTYTSDDFPTPPILAAKFAKVDQYLDVLAIANEDGKIAIQNTELRNDDPSGEQALEGEQCHFNAVFDIEWMPGHMKLVSASGDHTARLWSVTESKLVSTQVYNGHSRSVKTAAFRQNDPAVFATGGRDGAIIIWDTRAQLGSDLAPRVDNRIFSGHSGGPGTPLSYKKRARQTPKIPPNVCSSSITGLVFQDDSTLISCGAGDGIIKVWDIRRHYSTTNRDPLPKYSFPYPGKTTLKGYTNLQVDPSRNRLYANCMDNNIYCLNIASYDPKPIQVYEGLKNGTFYIKSHLSPDGQYLISGSTDEKAYIWNIDYPKPVAKLNGHTVEVTCVAWRQRQRDVCIVTCSDDARHKIWRPGPVEMDENDKLYYKGFSEFCEDYRKQDNIKVKLKSLEFTPRAVRRMVEKNERTPNTIEKKPSFSMKRTFNEMIADELLPDVSICPEIKRPNIETRGRRLFSPQSSNLKNSHTLGLMALEIASSSQSACSLSMILEESENLNFTKSPLTLSDMNLKSPEAGSSMPTLSLPNFVIDGEAPHLANVSTTKKKMKENLDWLTKIRKQKLLSNGKCPDQNSEDVNLLLSPRLQMLKTSDDTPPSMSPSQASQPPQTPRRRNSKYEGSPNQQPQPRTPNSARRHTCSSRTMSSSTPERNSIKKFFVNVTPTNKA